MSFTTTTFVDQIAVGDYHVCVLSTTDNEIICWGYLYGNDLRKINLGNDFVIKEIVAGSYHTCAMSYDNKIKCWGRNSDGQLGQNNDKDIYYYDDTSRINPIKFSNDFIPDKLFSGGNSNCVISTTKKVKCWGE